MGQTIWIVGCIFGQAINPKTRLPYPLWTFGGAYSTEEGAIECCKREDGDGYHPAMYIFPTVLDGERRIIKQDVIDSQDDDVRTKGAYFPYRRFALEAKVHEAIEGAEGEQYAS